MALEVRFYNNKNENMEVFGLSIWEVKEDFLNSVIDFIGKCAMSMGAVDVSIDDTLYEMNYDVESDEIILEQYYIYDDVDDLEQGYESNCFCDNTGFCGGWSCPQYKTCHA
jgi:hypothetical protein